MKSLIAMAVLALPVPANADCGCGSQVLASTVNAGSPQIVVEYSCGKKPPRFTLVDPGGNATPLTPVAQHAGYQSMQLVLEPGKLAAGAYQLRVEDGYQKDTHAIAVVATTSTTPPVFGALTVGKQSQVEYGCGPGKRVEIVVGPTQATLARVELATATGKMTGYTIVEGGKLGIGHGMCEGPFDLRKGKTYSAEITLLAPRDATVSTAKSVTFTYSP